MNVALFVGVQSPYMVQGGGYGQTGRGGTRPTASSAAVAMRAQQGQYGPGQTNVTRGAPQTQRMAAGGAMVQNQGTRSQQMVRFSYFPFEHQGNFLCFIRKINVNSFCLLDYKLLEYLLGRTTSTTGKT